MRFLSSELLLRMFPLHLEGLYLIFVVSILVVLVVQCLVGL